MTDQLVTAYYSFANLQLTKKHLNPDVTATTAFLMYATSHGFLKHPKMDSFKSSIIVDKNKIVAPIAAWSEAATTFLSDELRLHQDKIRDGLLIVDKIPQTAIFTHARIEKIKSLIPTIYAIRVQFKKVHNFDPWEGKNHKPITLVKKSQTPQSKVVKTSDEEAAATKTVEPDYTDAPF